MKHTTATTIPTPNPGDFTSAELALSDFRRKLADIVADPANGELPHDAAPVIAAVLARYGAERLSQLNPAHYQPVADEVTAKMKVFRADAEDREWLKTEGRRRGIAIPGESAALSLNALAARN